MIPATPHPVIRTTTFKKYKPGAKEPSEVAGWFEWKPQNAPLIKAHFHLKKAQLVGYLLFRYVWKMAFVKSMLTLVATVNNYGHSIWVFRCPKCLRGRKNLVFTDGPIWICQICAKLKTIYSRENVQYKKMDVSTLKKNLSSRSITKKKKALERLISLREQLLVQRRRLYSGS